jgi:hypothetical protein
MEPMHVLDEAPTANRLTRRSVWRAGFALTLAGLAGVAGNGPARADKRSAASAEGETPSTDDSYGTGGSDGDGDGDSYGTGDSYAGEPMPGCPVDPGDSYSDSYGDSYGGSVEPGDPGEPGPDLAARPTSQSATVDDGVADDAPGDDDGFPSDCNTINDVMEKSPTRGRGNAANRRGGDRKRSDKRKDRRKRRNRSSRAPRRNPVLAR